MTNLAKHINPNLFEANVEAVPNRMGYGEGLREAGEADERVVALSADLTGSTKTSMFAEHFLIVLYRLALENNRWRRLLLVWQQC